MALDANILRNAFIGADEITVLIITPHAVPPPPSLPPTRPLPLVDQP